MIDIDEELTEHEKSCLNSLKRLAKKWNKEPNRLWLYSANSSLWVMLGRNMNTRNVNGMEEHYTNDDDAIASIDIPNEGGDW